MTEENLDFDNIYQKVMSGREDEILPQLQNSLIEAAKEEVQKRAERFLHLIPNTETFFRNKPYMLQRLLSTKFESTMILDLIKENTKDSLAARKVLMSYLTLAVIYVIFFQRYNNF